MARLLVVWMNGLEHSWIEGCLVGCMDGRMDGLSQGRI